MTTFTLNRRTLLTGTVALGTVGLLAACGGNSSKNETSALSAGDDLSKAVSYNEKDRSALKDGGELRLSADGIGPNFNILNTNGYTAGNLNIQAAINSAFTGGFYADFRGESHMNEDYVTEYKAQTVDGVQTVTFKINPKAAFNDGTPIDVNAVKSYQTIYTAAASGSDYQITPSPIWEQVASVEAVDGDTRHVKVTMSKPWYPIEGSFTSFLHPAFVEPKFFNDGLNDKPLDQYWAGPFTLADKGWDSTAKTFSVVPNDKWWGAKPLLDKIVFTQMESSAARAAFKNDEIDAIGASTSSTYAEVKNIAGTELRKGTRLYAGGLDINPRRVKDAALRKAIFVGTNREALAKIQYQGLPYEETIPGSMIHMPFSPYYQDSYPTPNNSVSEAQKILEAAGYTKNGDYYEKDGTKAGCAVVVFGDDPTNKGKAQTFTQQMKDVGIEIRIDQHADSEFATILGNWDYDISFSGYSVSADATEGTKQFYYSENNEGIGSKEIDALIDAMTLIEDDKERNLACNEIEKKHMAEFAFLGTITNGPDFVMVKKTLANYGPHLYKSMDWTAVGWMNS